jgi:hypothetical protein
VEGIADGADIEALRSLGKPN